MQVIFWMKFKVCSSTFLFTSLERSLLPSIEQERCLEGSRLGQMVVKAALHIQLFERAGAATKQEHAQLVKF